MKRSFLTLNQPWSPGINLRWGQHTVIYNHLEKPPAWGFRIFDLRFKSEKSLQYPCLTLFWSGFVLWLWWVCKEAQALLFLTLWDAKVRLESFATWSVWSDPLVEPCRLLFSWREDFFWWFHQTFLIIVRLFRLPFSSQEVMFSRNLFIACKFSLIYSSSLISSACHFCYIPAS